MRADIWLGVVTIFMAVLGGIVSAHAPAKLWQKVAYVSAFMIAGVWSIWLVIRISNENAAAAQGLANALNQLTASTGEIARITALNTALQEKLVASSGTITKLAEENLLQTTGSKGYCYFVPSAVENSAGLPLLVLGTKYPVYDVNVEIIQWPTDTNDPEATIRAAHNPILSRYIGNVSGQYFHHIGYNLPVQRGRNNRYQINIYSRSALFTEHLVVTWNNGHWNFGVDLGKNGTNDWILKTPKDFPYLDEPKH
jgi:hypothetical protein